MLDTTQNSISDLSLYDFEVETRQLALIDNDSGESKIIVPENMGHGVMRLANNHNHHHGTILGIVGPRTKIHPYKENCEIVNEALSNNQDIDLTDIKITNEVFDNGAFMRRTIEFPRMPIEPQVGDIVNFRIVHFDSYNSKWATQVIAEPMRLWCLNGCTTADYTVKYYSRHGNNGMTLKQFTKTLEDAVIDFQDQEGRFKKMINTKLIWSDARKIISFFAKTNIQGTSGKSARQKDIYGYNFSKELYDQIFANWQIEYVESGDTLFTLYNAFTRWATHGKTTGQAHTVQRNRNTRIAQLLKSDKWKQLEAA